METTFVITGLTTLGGIIVFPFIMEFFRQHLGVVMCGILALIMLSVLSPHSPQARAIWLPISDLPGSFIGVLASSTHGMRQMGNGYFNKFHP